MNWIGIAVGGVMLGLCVLAGWWWFQRSRQGDMLGGFRKRPHDIQIHESKSTRQRADDAYRRTVSRHYEREQEQRDAD